MIDFRAARGARRLSPGSRRRSTRPRAADTHRTPAPPMNYTFRFRDVFAAWDFILEGVATTLWLSAATMVFGLIIGVLCAAGRLYGPRLVQLPTAAYVEVIRNTPLLIQLFIVFFGSPASAAAGCDIRRHHQPHDQSRRLRHRDRPRGFQAVPRTQVEAGQALGLSGGQVFRHVILFPRSQDDVPALASQFILLMLATSIASQIAVQDLFHAGSIIQSRTFRDFEVYAVVGALYLALALGFRHSSPSSTIGRSADDDPRIRPHRCVLPHRRDALDVAAHGRRLRRRRGGRLLFAILRVAPFAPLRWLAIAYNPARAGHPAPRLAFRVLLRPRDRRIAILPWIAAAFAFRSMAGPSWARSGAVRCKPSPARNGRPGPRSARLRRAAALDHRAAGRAHRDPRRPSASWCS